MKYKKLFDQVLPVLISKMEEFNYYGYDGITMEDLWDYCIRKKWRKKDIESLRLYEVVSTIYSISASDIVSHTQIQDIQSTNWFVEINQDELNELLKREPVEKES